MGEVEESLKDAAISHIACLMEVMGTVDLAPIVSGGKGKSGVRRSYSREEKQQIYNDACLSRERQIGEASNGGFS